MLRVAPQQQARTLIAAQGEEIREAPTGEDRRNSRNARVVRCNDLARLPAPRGDKSLEHLATHQRLIGQYQHHAVAGTGQSLHAEADGAGNTFLPIAIDEQAGAARRKSLRNGRRMSPEHDSHAGTHRIGRLSNRSLQHRLAIDSRELLGRAEAAGRAGGEHERMERG